MSRAENNERENWSPEDMEDKEMTLTEEELEAFEAMVEAEMTEAEAAVTTRAAEPASAAMAEDMDMDDLKEMSDMMNDGMTPNDVAEWMMDNDLLEREDFENVKEMHQQICGAIEQVYGEANNWEMADKDTKTQIQGEWTN